MRFAIIASRQRFAGENIASHLTKLGINVNFIDEDIIYPDNIDKKIDADFFIFASTHKGKQERILTIHAPGNWNKAELGGKSGKVCPTSAIMLKHFFKILDRNKKDWQVTLECTHHGPYIEKSCLFIEIGSNEKNWKDNEAGEIIARTIKEAINSKPENYPAALGIGGPHYCPNFTKIQLSSNIAMGHIIPQYAFPLTEEMLLQAIEKTKEKVELVILDWKGLDAAQRIQAIELCKKLNLNWKKTSEIQKSNS